MKKNELLIPAGALVLGSFFLISRKPKKYRLDYNLERVEGLAGEGVASRILHELETRGEILDWQWDGREIHAVWQPDAKKFSKGDRKSRIWERAGELFAGAYLTAQTEVA